MVSIRINGITEEQVKAITKALKGCGKITYLSGYKPIVLQRRLELILSTYDICNKPNGKVSLEALFRKARRDGYRMNRRTFQRDIMILELTGQVTREVYNGGKFGKTTLLARALQNEMPA
jgi:hypothetical protein